MHVGFGLRISHDESEINTWLKHEGLIRKVLIIFKPSFVAHESLRDSTGLDLHVNMGHQPAADVIRLFGYMELYRF